MSAIEKTFFYSLPFTVILNSFPSEAQIKLPFLASKLIIANDSSMETVIFSFNGSTVHGDLFDSDSPIVFEDLNVSKIWFRRAGAKDADIRVWAWRR